MAYQWSPDYSSFINTDQYPGATWHAADYGGGSEGASPTAAGWYSPAGWDSGGSEGGPSYNPGTRLDAPVAPDYWSLKNAGLWNLTDPNSDTWKFLQASGGGGDVKTDPNAFAHALMYGGQLGQAAWSRDAQGRAQVEGAYKDALNGLNPDFVNKFANAMGQNTEGYWEASKQAENQGFMKDVGDVGSDFKDMITKTPLGAALGAYLAAPVAAGAAAGGGAAEGVAASYAGQGALSGLGATGTGATLGGGMAALKGGSLEDILKAAGTGALGGAVGQATLGGSSNEPGVDDAITNEAIDADSQFDVGNSMPGATPEMDPTFGGQLQQTGAGQFEQLQQPPSDLSSMVNGAGGMPPAQPEQDPTFGGQLQQTGPGVFQQPPASDLASMTGGASSQLGEPTGTQLDAGAQPSGAETSPIGTPDAGMTSTELPDLQTQLGGGFGFDPVTDPQEIAGLDNIVNNGNSGITGNPTQGGNMDDFGDDFGGDLNLGGGDDLSGFDDIFDDNEDFGNLFGNSGEEDGFDSIFDDGNDGPSDGGFGQDDEDLFDGFDAGENGSGLDGLKVLLKKGFGGLGSALGKIPAGNLASGILAAKMGQKNLQGLKDMQQKAIDSDLWRPQQSRYFEPAYDAATKGIGNTAYGQSIASDTNRNMAAQGYNMSGNQMHEVAQGLNRGSMDYLKAVGPLATGRAPAGDGSGYASGVSGAYNLFNQGAQAGLSSIINGTGGPTGTTPGPTLGDLASGIKNSVSL